VKNDEKLPACQYIHKYKYPGIKPGCSELTDGKFCIFHDKDHYAEYEEKATKRFEKKVSDSISQNEPLECIGYYLSNIAFAKLLKEKGFRGVVYFNEATFYKEADFSGAEFSKEANFHGATFSEQVDFTHAKFSEEADFSLAKFSKGASFSGATFSEVIFFDAKFSEADFSRASFSGKANFQDATFSKGANFSDATFSKFAAFNDATFSEGANFSDATFSEGANFSDATFSKGANFVRATFSELAFFAGAKFSRADFDDATFIQIASFSDATFSKGANFAGATFSKEAIFARATFSKEASFSNAEFSEEADFSTAKFTEGANFAGATFTGAANFSYASFSRADFSYATFIQIANFSYATFSEKADFVGATFTERANFASATFSKAADFGGATFLKAIDFTEAKFLAETYFLRNRFGDKALFKYAIFGEPSKVIFDDSDLSSVSFAGSNSITTIRFGDKIKWRRVKNEVTIIEEEWLKDKVKGKNTPTLPEYQDLGLDLVLSAYRNPEYQDVSLDLVLSAYRNLRENFEFRLKFDDGGKLFIREMELKRNYRHVSSKYELKLISFHRKLKRDKSPLPNVGELIENGWFRKHLSLTGLYYHLSRYGESISRPTLIAVITVTLSTLFWVTQSNPTLEPHFDSSLAETVGNSTFVGFREVYNDTQWLKALERSFADFLPLLPAGDFKVGIIDFIIKIVGGALTFGLLIIALRRKFERKYTR
jgi:uncharacterized protein YjbI with pentapeptide repeats